MKQMGKLVIQAAPAPDVLTLDGKSYAAVPVKVWLTPGSQQLHVEKTGHAPQSQTVEVKAGVRAEVRVRVRHSGPSSVVVGAPERHLTGCNDERDGAGHEFGFTS